MAWRRYWAGTSPGMTAGPISAEGQHIAHFPRPRGELEPVAPEQRQRDALEAKAHAGAVGDLSAGRLDVEGHAEMVHVVVARADGGGLLGRADRDHELELERLLALHRLLHLAAAPEERVVGDHRLDR